MDIAMIGSRLVSSSQTAGFPLAPLEFKLDRKAKPNSFEKS